MALGIPYLTLGADGTPVAQYGDGTVVPLQSIQLGGSSGPETTQGSGSGIGAEGPQTPDGSNGGQGGPGALGGLASLQTLPSSGGLASLGQAAGDQGGGYLGPVTEPSPYPSLPPSLYTEGQQSPGTGLYGMGFAGPGDGYGPSLAPAGNSQTPDYGGSGPSASGPSGGGGGTPDVGARLADARSRLASAKYKIQSALGGSGYSSTSSTTSTAPTASSSATNYPYSTKMHGKYAHGLDPQQALGLVQRPTSMLPLVWHGLNPSNPAYTTLSGIPAGAMAELLGKGTPSSIANTVGRIYHGAGSTGDLPSTDQLLQGLTRGKGLEQAFEGVKAGKGDYPSAIAPGYRYGYEPMSMSEASGAMAPLLDAALYNEPLDVQAKYSGTLPGGWGSSLIDQWGAKSLKRPAGKGPAIYRYLGRHLFR